MIAEKVDWLRRKYGGQPDPARRGPVNLNLYFGELRIDHVALPNLSVGAVRNYLLADGVTVSELGDNATALAGCLFATDTTATAFVKADDILPRRRFSAAHELGHAVLHRGSMGNFIQDALISDSDESENEREREANAFAAELLMPEEICRARAEELRKQYGVCPRSVLSYRLAGELLVSRLAMDFRLKKLGVGDAK